MLIGWSGDNGDPDNWLGTLYGCDAIDGNNFSKWCYKPYDDLIKQAKATSDQASAPSCTRRPSTSSRNRCRSRRSPTPRSTNR